MKFQKLILHNLASIEDAVVDFEAAPLADSEVFLITGQTGSGKSTLLDAICLALYADTPRLKNTQMQGKNLEGKQAIQCSDPRQLLRQGAGEGFVKLTFTGSDGVAYEATWEVARAYRKPTGNLQAKRWELRNLQTERVLTKDDEIREAVARAVGLDFAQFCRTTLLAQGDFTRFLNSKDEEKAAILEKITGTEVYSKIGMRVYERTVERRQAWEAVKKQVNDLQTLTEKERSERLELWRALEGRMAEQQAQLDRVQRVDRWRKEATATDREVREAKRTLQEAEALVDSPDFRAREQQVKQWKETQQVRADRRAMQTEEAERNRLQRVLQEELAVDFARLSGAWQAAQALVDRRQRAVDRGRAALEREAGLRPFYAEAKALAGQLRDWTEAGVRRQAAEQQAAAGRKAVEETCNPAVNRAEAEWKKAEAALEQERRACVQAEAALEALRLEPLKRGREALQRLSLPLQATRVQLAHEQESEEKFREAQRQLAERDGLLAERRKALADMLPRVQQAQEDYDRCRRRLEVQRDTVDKFAQTLRARLEVGMECPVCRQVLTRALPTEDELKQLVDRVQAETDAAQRTLQERQQEQFRLQAFVQNETEALEKERKQRAADPARQQVRKAVQKAGRELGERLEALRNAPAPMWQDTPAQALQDGAAECRTDAPAESRTDAPAETAGERWEALYRRLSGFRAGLEGEAAPEPAFYTAAQAWLEELQKAADAQEAAIGRRLKEGEAVEKQVQEGHRQRERRQQQVDQAREAVFQAQQKRQEMEGQVRTAEALQQAEAQKEAALLQALHTGLAGFPKPSAAAPAEATPTFPDWPTEPLAFAEALLQAEARDRQAQERQQQEEQLLQQDILRCQEGAQAVRHILDTLPKWEALEAIPCPTPPADWTGALHRLHARVAATVEQGKAARLRAEQYREAVAAFCAAHPEWPLESLDALQAVPASRMEDTERELLALRQQVAGQQTLLQAALAQAARVEAERPPFLEEVLRALTAADGRPDDSPENTPADGLPVSPTASDATDTDRLLGQALLDLPQELLALSERKGGLQQELKVDAENRKKQGDLHEKAVAAEQLYLQWARLNELVGDATGKKFRQIAQSYVLDNLIHSANHYLAKLTDRYTLKVKPGGFLILLEDAYQGFASRVASTLSGGESFLVSLALALALSDIGHEFSVDTLFIDEGFGTLSGEPLQQAIQTLRSLHSQSGRHVGIISHVEELRERIPVQIRVEQEARDSSSRVRVIPETE